MLFSTGVTSLGLMATIALAAPNRLTTRQRSGGSQVVVYWGQNGYGSTSAENADLSTYCQENSGIDILALAFLYNYGNGTTIPSGRINSCVIDSTGKGEGCGQLAQAIATCKANGVKVLLSIGGAIGSYSLQSQEEAETIGQNLWDAFGSSGKGNVPRPFGDVAVDGFDFDIESNNGNDNYQFLISKLRSNFGTQKFYISGAPQCPIPEPNMQQIITKAQFDFLFIQFYNNEVCLTDGTINFNEWTKNIADTPSSNAKIFIGVPASHLAATGTSGGAKFFLPPTDLATLVSQHKNNAAFGGVMMWNAAFSDSNVNNQSTYAQQAKSILTTGKAC